MRLSIFPLPGAVLFPGLHLPLHMFEPRYRALVSHALSTDRKIAMIQPREPRDGAPLFDVGCIGRIADVEALEDGRYNLTLEGESRFRLLRELDVVTPFRQVEGEAIEDTGEALLSLGERASLEHEGRIFADARGYSVDWDSVARLDDESLVNGIAQIAPFDYAAKQALLESPNLRERCDLLVQLLQFFGYRTGDDDDPVTLQ